MPGRAASIFAIHFKLILAQSIPCPVLRQVVMAQCWAMTPIPHAGGRTSRRAKTGSILILRA
jgi:hypothetical protein